MANRILSIDPGGTTGFFFTDGVKQEFHQFTSPIWKEQLKFLIDYLKTKQPNQIIYEHTNYIGYKGKNMTNLLNFFGAIESLVYTFSNLMVSSIPVNQVKETRKKLLNKKLGIIDLLFQPGKGWFYPRNAFLSPLRGFHPRWSTLSRCSHTQF